MLYDEEVRFPDGGLGREVTPEMTVAVPGERGRGGRRGRGGPGAGRSSAAAAGTLPRSAAHNCGVCAEKWLCDYYSSHSANTADTPDIIALQRKYNQTNIKNGLVAVDPFSLNVLSHK